MSVLGLVRRRQIAALALENVLFPLAEWFDGHAFKYTRKVYKLSVSFSITSDLPGSHWMEEGKFDLLNLNMCSFISS